MEKVSQEQVLEVMEKVGHAIRGLTAERDEAVAKVAMYERRFEAEKVASVMIQKGATNDSYEHVVEQMEKAAERGELDVIRRALDLSGPDMGEKVAQMVGDENSYASDGSASDFERCIMGDIG